MQTINNKPDIISTRTFGKLSYMTETKNSLNNMSLLINHKDRESIQEKMSLLVDKVNITCDIVHRDFQSKNIMIHNNKLHIIDSQDMCIGTKLHDLVTMLYESSIVITSLERDECMKYYYEKSSLSMPYDEYINQIRILALFRIIKSLGTHYKLFTQSERWQSLELIYNNKNMLVELADYFPDIINLITRYSFSAVIPAAGKGSRMQDVLPKALCKVNGEPMLQIIINRIAKLLPDKIIVIVGHKADVIIDYFKDHPLVLMGKMIYVEQTELLGTGHAVLQASNIMSNYKYHCLIHYADNPNIKSNTLGALLNTHVSEKNDVTISSYIGEKSCSRGGRVIRNEDASFNHIHEDYNENFYSDEFIGGLQIHRSSFLFKNLPLVTNNNAQSEYYLSDVINYTKSVGAYKINNKEMINANTKSDIEKVEQLLNEHVV